MTEVQDKTQALQQAFAQWLKAHSTEREAMLVFYCGGDPATATLELGGLAGLREDIEQVMDRFGRDLDHWYNVIAWWWLGPMGNRPHQWPGFKEGQ